jgi:hypothetical protein
MKRAAFLLGILFASVLVAGCEGMINPTKKTNEGMNTLAFRLDGETLSAGGQAPDWIRAIFGIFTPRPEEDEEQEPFKSVQSGIDETGDWLWIQAWIVGNKWDARPLELYIPVRRLKEGATIDFPDIQARMPYVSGHKRDSSFMQGYAYIPIKREAEFLSGALHIRTWDAVSGILSGEFKFKVRMITEEISNEMFRSGTNVHPDDYVVRPRETHTLEITRGVFDVNYLE